MRTSVSFSQIPGRTFEVKDKPENDLDRLVQLYDHIGKMHYWTTYIGEDPFSVLNETVRAAQSQVIDRIKQLVEDGDAIPSDDSN